ncbi:MAG TPA: Asp-tRNA(Asn)/Glu-tRNA(Gln) amidotransferase subunit GatB, partial [Gammaproteobacteria bacterium]|nr:Asp-tRNA(Asn)/Glu-tRNA(Gln) amidotransferase subunit GatB [Gammaproteobacteria bacterium]
MNEWETVIGLEVHVQLNTKSKIFSPTATTYGAPANTQASAVDLALPGVLPVINREAVVKAICFGMAVGGTIESHSIFARKNYFYPDLPKGYQISQFELPIVSGGSIRFEVGDTHHETRLVRAHLEEDAGKSVHDAFGRLSGIDLNRAGTPLLEVVTEPDMRSPAEAVAYLRTLHTLVRYLDICDGNLEEGSFRCDANVSIRPQGQTTLGTRTELKNINSFRFVEQALDYEIDRQIAVVESGGAIAQETRLYDADQGNTRPMRSKEEAHDYRYFPDPDLPPLLIGDDLLKEASAALPELPDNRQTRFVIEYGLTVAQSRQLIRDRDLADFFESAVIAAAGDAFGVANWMGGEMAAALNRDQCTLKDAPITPVMLGDLVVLMKGSFRCDANVSIRPQGQTTLGTRTELK